MGEAAAAAVAHIKCQDYVRVEMALGGSYMDGVEMFRHAKQVNRNHLEQFARLPR